MSLIIKGGNMVEKDQHDIKIFLVIVTAVVGITMNFFISPLPLAIDYAECADTRIFFGVPSFLNIFSCIFLMIFGLNGLWAVKNFFFNQPSSNTHILALYAFAFMCSIFLGGSSMYYHLDTVTNIMWEMYATSITFLSILCIAVSERGGKRLGYSLFFPLLLIIWLSASYWEETNLLGNVDFRYFTFTEFLPLLLLIIAVFLFPNKVDNTSWYFMIGTLIFSIICEFSDYKVYSITKHIVSGHTLKHLFCSLAIYYLYQHYTVISKYKLDEQRLTLQNIEL
jgi:hypothetical protein